MHHGLADINPSTDTICMYAEFLARRFKSPKSVKNYISGVRLLHKYVSVEAPALRSFELDLMIRALDLTMGHTPQQRLPVNLLMLKQICDICDTLGSIGLTFKFAFLAGFFGFLRAFNIAPRTASDFDRRRHTCRGDVLFGPPGILMLLKWTKTARSFADHHVVPLPAIENSPLCPVRAYKDMVHATPTRSQNDPLLTRVTSSGEIIVITSGLLRRGFSVMLTALGYSPRLYSLHSLRRGGATAAFNANVDYIHIKRHGTWKSDSFSDYIARGRPGDSAVANRLAVAAKNVS